ncbi:MAG: response regulator transcription factor [Chloroflexi bacterium]|nr:response regulator transcription factor [Chloroflexota bacterium]
MSEPAGKILVIEDHPPLAEFLAAILTDAGFDVVVASDGAAGLATYEELQPDCILLDLLMPLLDGAVVIDAIRERDKETVIVVLSALRDTEVRLRMLQAGADDYVEKPFASDQLVARVARSLESARPRRGSPPTGAAS